MKYVLVCFMLLFLLKGVNAQDTIFKQNGDEVIGRVLEITLSEVIYQHPDSAEGRKWAIPKQEVFMIRFANGTKEVLEQLNLSSEAVAAPTLTAEQLYLLGREDALKYYTGSNAFWGSFAFSLLLFPYGYIGSAAIALTPPKIKTHSIPDLNLLAEPSYKTGYQEQAFKQKKRKAVAGAGAGTAVIVGTVIIILSALGAQ
ncbi:hypothetical protein [Pontibacter sp. SGAir0037]|uniref:hypothetical protein n=1 Tax=Pontibacter sp. SGAir0037 TaxID=2571030 RepID=UPI0010CD4882|nr:hypothetical protein [Pontibacter sp. SGAir0037]QCR21271.1 hypothetical protein C1N53_02165 [Pontibacter sp. SGAir0037]